MDAVKKIIVKDENIDSLVYDEDTESVIVTFNGGSKWVYKAITQEQFADCVIRKPREILELLRHNNFVGVRVK